MSINNSNFTHERRCDDSIIESMKEEHPREYWIIYNQAFCSQVENYRRHDYGNVNNQIAIFGKCIKDFTSIEREAFDDAECDIDYYFELGSIILDVHDSVKQLLESY